MNLLIERRTFLGSENFLGRSSSRVLRVVLAAVTERGIHMTRASFGRTHLLDDRTVRTHAYGKRVHLRTHASGLARASSGACLHWRGHLQALDWELSRRFPSWV